MIKKYFFWIVLIGVLILGIGVIRAISNAIYTRDISRIHDQSGDIAVLTQFRVAKSTDIVKLVSVGQKLLAKNQASYAKHYFKRASDLDLNVRDAAYGWAYAVVKSHDGALSQPEIEELNQAIDRAEKVDPLYRPLLQLKLSLAKGTGNQVLVEQTQKRLDLLRD